MSDEGTQAHKADVVIVGGGLCGLTAAYALKTIAPYLNCVVLEVHDLPGGRVNTDVDDFADFGGAYIAGEGGSQNYVQLLVRQLELPTFPQFLPQDKDW